MSSDVANVYVGAVANDGTGDAIRTAFQTVNSNFYNLDNRVSVGNIAVIFASVGVTAQTFVSNSYSKTQTLEVYQTANVAGNTQIGNLSVNNAFVASSITSTANTTVGSGLTVNGTAHFKQNVVVVGNLTVLGNASTISSQDLAIQDSIIQLHTPANLAPLTVDDGNDIGLAFHYYKGSDKVAALVWANDTQSLEFYASGVETAANTFSGTYGNVKVGSLFVSNTTITADTTTGAIVARGGIASAGNIAGVNFLGNLYGTKANVSTLSVSGTVVGPLYLTGTDTVYINGSPVSTSATSFAGGTVPGYTLFNVVLEARGNIFANSQVTSTSTTTGALVVNGGAGISGNLYVGGGFSVASIQATPIGNVTASSGTFTTLTATTGNIVAASGTESSGITTGALVVKGGAGISGNLYVGGSINNTSIGVYGAAVGNFTSIGGASQGTAAFSSLTTSLTIKSQGNIVANSGVVSTNTTTGALVVNGGLGVSGAIYNGSILISSGNIVAASGTASSSTTTGALVVSGGAGVSGAVYAGSLYDNGTRVLSTSSGAGNLSISGTGVTLAATGTAGTVGSGTAIPSITTDAYGRVTSITTNAVTAPAGTLSGGTLASGVTASSLTTVGVLTGLTVSGSIVPQANASVNLGDATHWFGTIYGVASQAKYADLAEQYVSDGTCGASQVVIFGGDAEITIATEFADTRVAGVISTNPAYLMNSDCYQGQPVALRGRVPVSVVGKVAKGDLLVSSDTAGCAVSVGKDKSYGPAIFAKSLNDKDDDGQGQIEAVIL